MSDEAVRELVSALRVFIRSSKLAAMSDAALRLVVRDISQELFDKHANEEEKKLLREELGYDADTRDIVYGKPN